MKITYAQRRKMYQDWFTKTVKSEIRACEIIADFLKVPVEKIEHETLKNGCSPYDLKFHDLTVDVKYSKPTQNKNNLIWDFDLRGKTDYCTHLCLMGMDRDGEFINVFLVPTKEITNKRHIRINPLGKSKWYLYLIWKK